MLCRSGARLRDRENEREIKICRCSAVSPVVTGCHRLFWAVGRLRGLSGAVRVDIVTGCHRCHRPASWAKSGARLGYIKRAARDRKVFLLYVTFYGDRMFALCDNFYVKELILICRRYQSFSSSQAVLAFDVHPSRSIRRGPA